MLILVVLSLYDKVNNLEDMIIEKDREIDHYNTKNINLSKNIIALIEEKKSLKKRLSYYEGDDAGKEEQSKNEEKKQEKTNDSSSKNSNSENDKIKEGKCVFNI